MLQDPGYTDQDVLVCTWFCLASWLLCDPSHFQCWLFKTQELMSAGSWPTRDTRLPCPDGETWLGARLFFLAAALAGPYHPQDESVTCCCVLGGHLVVTALCLGSPCR